MRILNQKGAIDVKFIVALVVLLAAAGVVFWMIQNTDETVSDTSTNTASESTLTPLADETSMANEEAQPVEEAVLDAVGDYVGSGTATRTIEGRFIHEVVASLDDPAEGDFYEGWLVGPTVVSTGKLTSEGGGEWSLVFESDEDLSQHNQVIITEETEANGLDGIPEDHVLEGSF